MRWFCPYVGIVLMTSATVSLAQGSLCNPCVDPPTIIPAEETIIPAEDMRNLGVFSVADMISQLPSNVANQTLDTNTDIYANFGMTVANLRGLNSAFGVSTLVMIETASDESESAAADDEFSDDSSDSREEESDIVTDAEQEQDQSN